MSYFIFFTVFVVLFTLSIEQQNTHMKALIRSYDIIDDYKNEEQFTRKCGGLLAARNNLDDSFTYLTKLNPKFQKDLYFLKYSLLSNLLQEKFDKLGCESESSKYLFAKTRRIKSRKLDEHWPKWVRHLEQRVQGF
ncbi:MAG: hypothetical protein AB8G05_21600 [Oligoflexales bacterium]